MNRRNSMLINYQLTPVHGMPWTPWYEGDMMWAEPDLDGLRKKMRYTYDNRDKVKTLGERGQKYVFKNFNWESRIEHMASVLETILGEKK